MTKLIAVKRVKIVIFYFCSEEYYNFKIYKEIHIIAKDAAIRLSNVRSFMLIFEMTKK